MIRICPTCGAENDPAAVHCRQCRGKLPEPFSGMRGARPSSRGIAFLRSAFEALMLMAVGAAGFWAKEHVDWERVRSGAGEFYGKCQHSQSDAANALRRWHAKWLTVEPARPAPAAPASTSAPPLPPPPPPKREVKIRCPRCGGVGYMGDSVSRSTCMLCNGDGGRTLLLPPGAEMCAACRGMGQVVSVVHGGEIKVLCKMCAGTGAIIRKY